MHIQTEFWFVEVKVTDNGPDVQPEVVVKTIRQDRPELSNAFFRLKTALALLPGDYPLLSLYTSDQWHDYLMDSNGPEHVILKKAFVALERSGFKDLGSIRALSASERIYLRNFGPKSTLLVVNLFDLK